MATNEIFCVFKKATYSSFIKDSGATYKSFVIPFEISFLTWAISVLFKDEFKTCATPLCSEIPLIAST